MVCIYCSNDTRVTNSRHSKRNNITWRRRQCKRCGAIFTTNEYIDLLSALAVRREATSQAFSRDTLFVSIYKSCGHRKNAALDAAELTNTIITKLLPRAESGAVKVEDIISSAHETLIRFDKAAATYYAAYYVNS